MPIHFSLQSACDLKDGKRILIIRTFRRPDGRFPKHLTHAGGILIGEPLEFGAGRVQKVQGNPDRLDVGSLRW